MWLDTASAWRLEAEWFVEEEEEGVDVDEEDEAAAEW